MRKPLLLVAGAVALAYLGVAFSPLKDLIGRTQPQLAAVFSPPLFNFHAKYSDGDVLDFKIGMSREQFRDVIRSYTGLAMLNAGCGGMIMPQFVQLDQPEASVLIDKDVVCLSFYSRRLSLIVRFREDRVDRVEVGVVNLEII